MAERFTVKNPDGRTYRVPWVRTKEYHSQACGLSGDHFGDFINKLGKIEDLDLDMDLVERLAKAPKKKLEEFLRTI